MTVRDIKDCNITEAVSDEWTGTFLMTVTGLITWPQKNHRTEKWHLRREQRYGTHVKNETLIRLRRKKTASVAQ